MEKFSRGTFFFVITYVVFFLRGTHVQSSLLPEFALLFLLLSTMLGLRAWPDDLNVVLFELLEDDTKLAQSCTDWLYVQHWYTVVPEALDARDALGAHESRRDLSRAHSRHTAPLFFLF